MKDERVKQVAENLIRELSDRGQIVEGGWRAYELLTGLTTAADIQRSECRKAYFFGAQHLFASLLSFLEGGEDATPADLERMDKLHAELERFTEEMKRQ